MGNRGMEAAAVPLVGAATADHMRADAGCVFSFVQKTGVQYITVLQESKHKHGNVLRDEKGIFAGGRDRYTSCNNMRHAMR